MFLWGFFFDLQYVSLALFAAEIGLIATARRWRLKFPSRRFQETVMRIMPTSLRTKFGHATTIATAAVLTVAALGSAVPAAAQEKKPNILFIMGDDIGLMQVGAYHQGWALGETPNIDRLAKEGRQVHGLLCDAELHLRA